MDELVELMKDDSSEGEEDVATAAVSDSSISERRRSTLIVAAQTNTTAANKKPDRDRVHPDLRPRPPVEPPQDRVEASIDDKLRIRMFKRRLSSMDLIDLLSCHSYHSPAALAAMSLRELNKLLVEPTSVVSAATVSGKTSITTVGIVFTNSGTRLSSNGRAFSVLSIGNLQTGPIASVFLFGEAYSQHCAKCPPGTVIAVITPNLLPPKQEDSSSSSLQDTLVSLSVGDGRQVVPVAQARDYGVCKGTVSTRRPDGQWISNGARCKHHVDIRVSEYCEQHRKQANVKNGSAAVQKNNGKTRLTFVQKERMKHGGNGGDMAVQPTAVGTTTVDTHHPSIEQEYYESVSRTTASGRFCNAPMHMKKQNNLLLQQSQSSHSSLLQVDRRKTQTRTISSTTTTSKASSLVTPQPRTRGLRNSEPVDEDWLKPKAKTTRHSEDKRLTGKRRIVNKDTAGYDGSVAVPKPSKLLRGKRPIADHHQCCSSKRETNDHERALKEDSIRQQQRLVAEHQKENAQSLSSGRNVTTKKKHRTISTNNASSSSTDALLHDSLFGEFQSVDTDQLLNARSQFAGEADAEAYANSRRIVANLERQEERTMHSKRKKKDQGSKPLKESRIQKEWICTTCNRKTRERPNMCIRAKHKVSFTRDVKKSDTVQDRRLKLDGLSAEDGGLKLGVGLEWDRRRRPTF